MPRSVPLLLAAWLLALGIAVGCRRAPEPPAGPPTRVRVVLRLGGDDLPSRAEVAELERLGAGLEAWGLGRVVRSAGGMGYAELWLEAPDPAAACPRVEAALRAAAPGRRFDVEATTPPTSPRSPS